MKKTIAVTMMMLMTQFAFATELAIYTSQDESLKTVITKVQNQELKCISKIADYAQDSLNVFDGLLNWKTKERRVLVITQNNEIDSYVFYNNAKELYSLSGLKSVNKCEDYSHTGVIQNLL